MRDDFRIVNQISAVKTFKGVDGQGANSLVFIFKKEPDFELKTNRINSRIVKKNSEFRLFISLVDDHKTSIEIFDVLSKDLLKTMEKAKNENEALEILSNRLQYWTELFKRKKEFMDEKWVRGFVGELWFLDNILSKKIGIDEAIKSWVGPEKSNQDFITSKKIFEIKTRGQQSNVVTISNNNQLERNMYLVVIELSRSSEVGSSSFNLSTLINSIKNKITSPSTYINLNEKLLNLGLYPSEEIEIYDKFSYENKSVVYYYLNDNFPILEHSEVPKGIVKYSYDLLLSSIEDSKTSEELLWT